MDMKELIERQDQERAASLASLPADVQAAFQRLPLEGRHQLLRYVEDFNDPSQDFQRNLDLKPACSSGPSAMRPPWASSIVLAITACSTSHRR